MKITRYFQSCLLIEEGGVRVLFDASGEETDNPEKFGELDGVFYTHEHGDHFSAEAAEAFAGLGVPVYANASTVKLMKNQPNIVSDGQEFDIKGLKIKAMELPHCPMPDGSAGPQNTGYLIADKLFDPGDGKELEGLKADILAVPIAGPDISIRDACDFAKQVSAKNVIPIHYDMMSAKPDFFVRVSKIYNMPFNIHPLAIGETAEL